MSIAGGIGSTPGGGTKILHAVCHSQKKDLLKKKNNCHSQGGVTLFVSPSCCMERRLESLTAVSESAVSSRFTSFSFSEGGDDRCA